MKICLFTSGVFPVRQDTIKAIEFWTFELAESLSKNGHEVHLFAARGSEGNFVLHPPKGGTNPHDKLQKSSNYYPYLIEYFVECLDYAGKNNFDLIHDQTSAAHLLPLAKYSDVPIISTIHVIRDNPDLKTLYERNHTVFNIAPSQYLADASNLITDKVILHGTDLDNFSFCSKGEEFISLGRIIPEKGQKIAVEAANIAKEKLTIAGYKIQTSESEKYFNELISEIEDSKLVNFVGKIERDRVAEFMGRGRALLMPIQPGEALAFGLVMIEAMACGTPVVAFDVGPVREIVEDGVTGFVVKLNDIDAFVAAMKKVDQLDRKACREHAMKKFSRSRMVSEYEEAYKEVVG